MIKIKLTQYKRRFELIYIKDNKNELTYLESLLKSAIAEKYNYSLSKDKFYFSNDIVSLNNIKNSLTVNVEKNNENHIYLSYGTLNNSFNLIPEKSLLNLENFDKYEFIIDITTDDTIKVVPYIIHYKKNKKDKLTAVIKSNQLIDFNDDYKCRLTFKIIGYGRFDIKKISIIPKG